VLRGRRQAAMLFGMSGSRGAPGRCAARLGLVKASKLVSSHPVGRRMFGSLLAPKGRHTFRIG